MKHIVFMVGDFYPNFSAVGNCAYQVLECLKDKAALTVIVQRNDLTQSLEEDLDGISIRRIETSYMRRRLALEAGTWRGVGAALFLHRVWGAIRRLLASETVDRALAREYLDCLNNIDPCPNAIVPLVFPIETAVAALAYHSANPEVSVYPYLFDNFVESGSLHVLKIARWLKRGRHLRLERRMLEEADTVLSMHPLREHFEANFGRPLINKITFHEHPLLTRPQEYAQRVNDGTTRLCFTGSLIRKVREPDYLLDMLRAMRVSTPLRADFFVMGNAAQKVRNMIFGDMIQIVNHGRVAKPDADCAVNAADILLNIGEVQGRQVSSKVFEYMATGKPIIHLAYVEGDATTKILAKYPLALCLIQKPERFHENLWQFTEFIEKNRHKKTTFSEVEKLYNEANPKTTAKFLEKLLNLDQEVPSH